LGDDEAPIVESVFLRGEGENRKISVEMINCSLSAPKGGLLTLFNTIGAAANR